MVDPTRVRRLLQVLSRSLSALERESGAGDERRADPLWLPGVEFTFVNAIEACIDIAHHLCSSEGWGPPDTNAEAMRVLGRNGVLSPGLADAMAAAVGFRNVLVHQYTDVDHAITVERLADHGSLREFARAVGILLVGSAGEPG